MNSGALLLIGGALLLLMVTAAAADDRVTGDEMPNDDFPDTVPVGSFETRLNAFLDMIGACEVGEAAMADGTAYFTFYRGAYFADDRDHPALTGEMSGVPLSDAMCRAAGFGPGCVSTAAGFAQINVPTWREVRGASNRWGAALPDFSPASQREAARRVMMLARVPGGPSAYDLLLQDDFAGAVRAASTRWASLPGSTAGQGGKSFETVARLYEGALYG